VSHAYKTTDIAFSPTVVAALTPNFMVGRRFSVALPAKYVSKEYLDNAQQETRKLDGYYVQNLRAVYTIAGKVAKETDIIFQLYNVFDKRYTPNGYTYSYIYGGALQTDNFVFPMAGTNFMLAVNIKL
jgi:iron complex outermembrane receptor protein